MRLIDADAIEYFPLDDVFNHNVMIAHKERIDAMPTVEIDEDMVIEYCRKRCLVIMTAELFADWFMNKRIEEAYHGTD